LQRLEQAGKRHERERQGREKAWLIAVVLSLGNAMNGHLELKGGELYVADANVATDGAYSLPTDVAKSLQKEVSAGQLKLGAMYEKIQKSLSGRNCPRRELAPFWGRPPLRLRN
jgi:hypothetical protein